jgi:hypothetical protein
MLLIALALALLPGLLIVRAPWTAVAPLSLAFWTLGAWWPPFAGPGRSRFVVAVLAASLLLAVLRLVPKHEVPPPPGWQPPPERERRERPGLAPPPLAAAPSLVVVCPALALLAPLPLWHHAPGPRLAFQTTTSRLLVWRDGIPASYEPLLPLEPVGAHAPALATLAADISLLTGEDPAMVLLAVVAAAAGLLLVGLFALHATWAPPRAAALGSLVALAVAPWPGFLSAWGEGEALLALGFLLPAAALLLGHVSRSSAVAAAALLGAGALAQPVLAAGAVVLAFAFALARRGPVAPAARRLAGSALLALVLAAPGLLPLARAVSAREALAIATAGRAHELVPFAFGLLLLALAPLAFAQAAGRRSSAARAAVAGAAVLAALLLVVRVHGWFGAGQLSESTRAALARAAEVTTPLDAICAGEGARDFVPALAGRRAGEPGVWIPRVYADEWARRERRPCRTRLEDLRSGP